jgi:hypothetical protein
MNSAIDFTAPLPLGYVHAVDRGLALRERGNAWTFTVIADVLRVYHGFDRSAGWWSRELRARGAEARPHGVPFGSVAA